MKEFKRLRSDRCLISLQICLCGIYGRKLHKNEGNNGNYKYGQYHLKNFS